MNAMEADLLRRRYTRAREGTAIGHLGSKQYHYRDASRVDRFLGVVESRVVLVWREER